MENVIQHIDFEFKAQTEKKMWPKRSTLMCLNNIKENEYNYSGSGQDGPTFSSGAVVLNVICQMMEYMFH